MPHRIARFPIHPTARADFKNLQRTLILVPGLHAATLEQDQVSITFDPEVTDLEQVRRVIRTQGYWAGHTEGPEDEPPGPEASEADPT
jgi:hypothetical protein